MIRPKWILEMYLKSLEHPLKPRVYRLWQAFMHISSKRDIDVLRCSSLGGKYPDTLTTWLQVYMVRFLQFNFK